MYPWSRRSKAETSLNRQAMRLRHTIATTMALCVAAAVVSTAKTAAQEAKAPGYARRWAKRLQENDERLQASDWKRAERDARRLLQDIVELPQGRLLEPVGAAAYQRALALAGLGRMGDARWYAEVARTFHPTIPVERLQSLYGEPGSRVADWFHGAAMHWDPVDPASEDCVGDAADPDLTPPAKLSGEDPAYTDALRRQRAIGAAAVSVVIDEEGNPHAPQLVQAQTTSIGFLWAALEALRTWRFEPARRDGEPVVCRYTVAMTFHLSIHGL